MKDISKEDVQNFLKTFDTETCAIIGDFYCEDIILEGRKSMKTIIADAIIAVDNILGSTSKVAWKNEEKIDFTIKFQRKPTHFSRWMNLVNFKINIFVYVVTI